MNATQHRKHVRITKHCCHGKTMPSVFIVPYLNVSVDNTQPYIVAMQTKQCVLSALMWSYKIFRTTFNKYRRIQVFM